MKNGIIILFLSLLGLEAANGQNTLDSPMGPVGKTNVTKLFTLNKTMTVPIGNSEYIRFNVANSRDAKTTFALGQTNLVSLGNNSFMSCSALFREKKQVRILSNSTNSSYKLLGPIYSNQKAEEENSRAIQDYNDNEVSLAAENIIKRLEYDRWCNAFLRTPTEFLECSKNRPTDLIAPPKLSVAGYELFYLSFPAIKTGGEFFGIRCVMDHYLSEQIRKGWRPTYRDLEQALGGYFSISFLPAPPAPPPVIINH